MLLQSLSLSVMIGSSAGLFCISLGAESDTIIHATIFSIAVSLLFAGCMDAFTLYHRAASRVQRYYWTPGPVIDQQKSIPEPVVPTRDIRLVPVRTSPSVTFASETRPVPVATRTMLDGVDSDDLAQFIRDIPLHGHSRRRWLGTRLPSGRSVDNDYYAALIKPLVLCGAIVDRTERAAGRVAMSPREMLNRLSLAG